MDKDITIKVENGYVRMWVDGEEVEDMIDLKFDASLSQSGKPLIRCSYWKYVREDSGRLLVLNNNILTEEVIVCD